jgi:hypothetical protein
MPIVQHLNKIKLEELKPNALIQKCLDNTSMYHHYFSYFNPSITSDNFTDQGKALALQFDTGKQINQVAP